MTLEHDKIVEYGRSAAAEVFSTMLSMELTALPERLDPTPPTITDGVMALVGLAGSCIGAGVITCSPGFAIDVCNRLLMAEENAVNDDVLDAMGEVANMIIGNFKTLAEEHVGPLGLSIPTVIYGRNFVSRSIGSNAWVVLPFEGNGDVMEVRICVSSSLNSTVTPSGVVHLVATPA